MAVKNSRNSGDSTHCSVESFENNGQTPRHSLPSIIVDSPEVLGEKEVQVRANLNSEDGMECESGVDPSRVPRHVAVIMDGNRRYGKAKYGSVSKGHWDGSSKLVEFAKWCIAEHISVLTVYAFSTENWTRDPSEVASLMAIFAKYSDELRVEAVKRNIRIHVLSTDSTRVSFGKPLPCTGAVTQTR
jgi:undecaprenyl pyrophosphate synthase